MSFLRRLVLGPRDREQKSLAADRALTERRLDEAERLLLELTATGQATSSDWWNLGLVHKFQKRWPESLAAFRKVHELQPQPEAYWNAGVAATALRDWATARWAWRGLGLVVGDGDGPPHGSFGVTPVRLNPDTDGEVVWGVRIDPCRARIESVPLPSSGHRWGDTVLHDVVPMGSRTLGDATVSVFDEIERMDPAPHETLQAELRWAAPEDERDLNDRIADRDDLGGENWTANIEVLCAQCSHADAHEHPTDRPDEIRLTGTWGFGGDRGAIEALLRDWTAGGAGRSAGELGRAEP